MKIELQAYSNNIVLSCLHGNKLLSEKPIEVKKNIKKYNTYDTNGQVKNYTVGSLFDKYI